MTDSSQRVKHKKQRFGGARVGISAGLMRESGNRWAGNMVTGPERK